MPEIPGAPGQRPPLRAAGLGPTDFGASVEHFLLHTLGFTPRPGKVIPKPTPFAITYLAPQPIGLVDPKFFGLPPDYFFGLTPHEALVAIGAERDQAKTSQIDREVQALKRRDAINAERQRLNLAGLTEHELVGRVDLLKTLGARGPVTLETLALVFELNDRNRLAVNDALKALAQRQAEKRAAADAAGQFLEALTESVRKQKPLRALPPRKGTAADALLDNGLILMAMQELNPPDP